MSTSVSRGLVLLSSLVVVVPALAAPNDIYLHGLLDDAGNPDDAAFQKMSTELGLVLTPLPMRGAETTGQSGFDFAIDFGTHVISFWEPYWQDSRVGTGLEGRQPIVPALNTVGVRGRKGFIFPIPLQSEVELGAQWLIESRLVSVGGKFHLALNEGFRWIPDVGVSVGVNRVIGSDDLDLTTATAGAQISKGFGLFGDANIMPFLSYESIFIDARTRIIDPDPRNTDDVGSTVQFTPVAMVSATTDDTAACAADIASCLVMNRYDRISGGLKLQVAVVQIMLGLDVNYLPNNAFPLLFQGGVRFGVVF